MVVRNSSNVQDPLIIAPPLCHTCNVYPANDARNLVVCIEAHSIPFSLSTILNRPRLNVRRMFESIVTNNQPPLRRQLKYMAGSGGVEDAYGWLAKNYQPGDEIYLFGFARGAYEVRALAGMIYDVGLIKKDSTDPTRKQISRAYHLYKSNRSESSTQIRKDASQFKHDNCWPDLRVHFVGVWDTLSPTERRRGTVPPISSVVHACHFRHALALDEDSAHPEYLQGTIHYTVKDSNDLDGCNIKEVWFEGSHSNLAGYQLFGIGNVPFLWMHREASDMGLTLEPVNLAILPRDCYFSPQQGSHSSSNVSVLQLCASRHIVRGQNIHASILFGRSRGSRANLLDGLPISWVQCSEGNNVDGKIWETELFNDKTVDQLIPTISQLDPILHPRKLLYMLQFKQGREYVRQLPGSQETLKNLVQSHLDQPATLGIGEFAKWFAYWEAFSEEEETVILMEQVLNQVLGEHVDSGNAILFSPIIRDEVLRKRLLTQERVKLLVKQLDNQELQIRFLKKPELESSNQFAQSDFQALLQHFVEMFLSIQPDQDKVDVPG